MAIITVNIADRRWANEAHTQRVLTISDPASPGRLYDTAPCGNTAEAETRAIQALINLRKAAGLDYPGQAAAAPETARAIA